MSTDPLQDNQWRGGGICDCCKDCSVCCKTIFCPCIVFGETRSALHGGSVPDKCCKPGCSYCLIAIFTGCLCNWAYTYGTRKDIRSKYNLPAEPCADCCVHFWCHPCALCQENRELKNRPVTTWPEETA